MKIRSVGVIKLAFNGKSRNNSLFTYNLQKESQEQLLSKFREKVQDFFKFYATFENKLPIKTFEAYSADYLCTNNCKIDMLKTKVSVVGVVYTVSEVKGILEDEGIKLGIIVEVNFNS